MMNFQLPSPPCCLQLANWLRVIQFLFKAVITWYILIDAWNNHKTDFQLAECIVSVVAFSFVYEIWRFYILFTKLKKYHLQWSFTIFDITASAIVTALYVDVQTKGIKKYQNLHDSNRILAILYYCYLIIPLLVFLIAILYYCKIKKAISNAGGMLASSGFGGPALGGAAQSMMNKFISAVGIQMMAVQVTFFRFIVYINILIATVIAIFSVVVNIIFINDFEIKGHEIFTVVVVFQLADIVLNFIEDRVICKYAKDNMGQFVPEPPLKPFNCCACGAFPQQLPM